MRKKSIVGVCILTVLAPVAALTAAAAFLYAVQGTSSQASVVTVVPDTTSSLPSNVSENTNTIAIPMDSGAFSITSWQLVLVNAETKLPDSFQPQITEAFDKEMDERIVEPYTQMYTQALEDGISLWISSAYRSPEKQQELFEREVQQNLLSGLSEIEAQQKAEGAVQRPYYSEHNTGLAIDFNGVTDDFKNDDAYQWLLDHAQEYGFVLRYPEEKEDITGIMYEPWHFRYVGVENAIRMNELGLCLEEYVNYLQLHPQQESEE